MNDTELIEFYKWLSEMGIIDDCYRDEGEAECAVKLYKNQTRLRNEDEKRR